MTEPRPQNPRLQALIDEVRSSSQRRIQAALNENNDYIDVSRKMDSVDEFLEVGQRAIDSMTLDGVTLADARRRGCRTQSGTWRPHAAGYIGHVANGDWYRIVRTAIAGTIGDLSIRQFSGDWKLAGARLTTFFEDTIEKRTANAADRAIDKTFKQVVKRKQTRFFLLVMEFIDLKGQAAEAYSPDDGMPVDLQAVAAAPDGIRGLLELARHADMLHASTGTSTEAPAEIADLRARNDALSTEMGELKAMMAQLLAAQQVAPPAPPAPASSRKRSRKPATRRKPARDEAPPARDEAPPADDIDEGLDALQALRGQDGSE
tara:strand:- start:1460 stop:2416 length:957 start_codon:yes stop_codon:yes gene_type:complete